MTRRRKAVAKVLAAFLETETSGGVLLLITTVAALIWANVSGTYESFWEGSPRHLVNDGLMALFFFVVGLEIKRELVVGELRDPKVAALAIAGAIGGMIAPAALYIAVTAGTDALRGWAIPIATDIAFVVGVLALLGKRIPDQLKVFMLALAIVDDIGAIVVIAIGYSGGVHPAIIGAVVGLLVPARPVRGTDVLGGIQSVVHPISSFFVVPVFALANAGVIVSADALDGAVRSRVFWGVVVGLVGGKVAGIVSATAIAQRLGVARRPRGVHLAHLTGGGFLGGIGFTVAIFIATLAFAEPAQIAEAKLGILSASVIAGVLGALVLLRFRRPG